MEAKLPLSGDSTWSLGQVQLAAEIFKVLFNVTIFLGPLETPPNPDPTNREKACWKRFVPFMQYAIALPDDAIYHRLKQLCVTVIVNTPQGCAQDFDISPPTLQHLIRFFDAQLAEADHDAEYLSRAFFFSNKLLV
jgi:hypothetical protein